MENLLKNDVEFKIYKVEEKFRGPFYYMVHTEKKNLIKNIIVDQVNFDIDKRGGLKIVTLENNVSLPKEAVLIIFGLKNNDFIPVNMKWESFYSEKEKCGILALVDKDEIFSILENKYLKYKNKYVLWDGVVQKVKYYRSYQEDNDYTPNVYMKHLYSIIDEISKDSH